MSNANVTDVVKDRVRPVVKAAVTARRRNRTRSAAAAVSVTGAAPTATMRALEAAARSKPSAEEQAWITRIELLRDLMGRSPQELEIVDFGAGVDSQFDTGDKVTQHTSTRTLREMTRSSKPPQGGYLLFQLVRQLKPASVLELGACVGISASYFAAALELNGRGRLITLEGAPVLAKRSARTLEELVLDGRAEVREGQFFDTLGSAVSDLAPVELAFIDGHHIESATLDYLEAIAPSAADEAVLIFDDITWSAGMRKAWDAIVADDRFALTVSMGAIGLAVISKSATRRQTVTLPAF